MCTPNTQFQWNGQICFCDSYGRWTEANCRLVQRQEPCKPGEMILNDCSQCICGENGQLVCTNIPCNEQAMKQNPTFQFNYFAATGPRCTPFRSYFINCTLCTCPASGKTSDATCVIDNSCVIKNPTSIFVQTSLKNVCIPKVMYLFPCLHCLCSDEGYFVSNTCVETCTKHHEVESRRCTPKTFYRKECNICWCPMNGIQSEMSCSKSTCKQNIIFQSLSFLENRVAKCKSQTFTKSTCFYCNCNTEGNVNLNSCFENECLKIANFAYGLAKLNCGPGELLPFCSECFCPQNGLTNKKYCTSTCSTPSKLTLIENVLLDSQSKNDLLNLNVIKRITSGDLCTPDTLYIDNERYCYCPDNGRTNFKICTSIKELVKLQDGNTIGMNIDFNSTCEAGTFVDFDCNTCYCMKNGKFDPKWCTNDDCNTKKIILKTNRAPDDVQKAEQTCVPGTISEDDCNYCICPDSGLLKERVCTKNDCTEIPNPIRYDKIICEPLTYYTVDCNICYCPRDGLKNIDRCTKNQCENNFLRSYSCTPGDLFSDYCNVCVCPPNGNKLDKLCTNHTCPETDIPSQKVFKLSQDLLENKVAGETARNLDLCFPGEEFVVGCKVCVCPDMGLKEYASCTPMLCNEANIMPETTTEVSTVHHLIKFISKQIINGSVGIVYGCRVNGLEFESL